MKYTASSTFPIASLKTQGMSQGTAARSIGCLWIVCNSPDAPEAIPIFSHDNQHRLTGDIDPFVSIGRSRLRNTHVIGDKSVSRQHSIFSLWKHRLYLRDNGSSLGTSLNGRRLKKDEEVLVQEGDLIGFGPIMYRIQTGRTEQLHRLPTPSQRQEYPDGSEPLEQPNTGSEDKSPFQIRMILAQMLSHNSKLQFFGYNIGNLILAVHQLAVNGSTHYGFNLETYAAIVLLIGSICAWGFHPGKRPYMLLYNGLLIIVGGILFYAAGYPMTGAAMVLASLEVARGGLAKLEDSTTKQEHSPSSATQLNLVSRGCGEFLLAWYILIVEAVTSKFRGLGRFVHERPFLTGPCIQLPIRIGFIGTMGLTGNWAGVAAGLSWTFLGDCGLALHDARFKTFVLRRVLRVEP